MPEALYRGGLKEDLRPISALFWERGIRHRIIEAEGAQVLLLEDPGDRERAQALFRDWQSGAIKVRLTRSATPPQAMAPGAALRRVPVTLGIIALGIAGFLLIYLRGPVEWLATLTFQPFTVVQAQPVFGVSEGEYWRFVTPVFLHFGWLHIAFNSLWCWELGGRIERALGSVNLAGLFLATAVFSNTVQHFVSGPALFGGLSGVVYGFLGFAWVAGRLNRRWRVLAPSPGIMLFMVGWLVVCLSGVFEVLGFSIANGAHLGGLLAGSFLGLVFAVAFRGASSSS